MDNEYFKFNPGTFTSRTPIPTTFEHLLGFSAKIEQYLTIHNQEDIVNINSLLEQTLNLQISNIIQRVIAQVIGETPTGFITIKGTEDGALHVSVQEDVISKKMGKQAKIFFGAAGSAQIIAAVPGKKICVVNIFFTVAGETNLTFRSAATDITGPMDFGGANEPRGAVSNMGNFPFKTAVGEPFRINSSLAVQVSGYVNYYEE